MVYIEIIVHKGKTSEEELQKLAAKIHAQYILRFIGSLTCPKEQKKQLLEAVADTLSGKLNERKT